jgi:hypothetical protein
LSKERRMLKAPGIQGIKAARQAFERNEPRDLFYRAATELVTLALDGKTSLTVAEAVAVLLQTWNKMFYQYRRFDSRHFTDIERLIREHLSILISFRKRCIRDLTQEDESEVVDVFKAFEKVLGPVGAAKCLHLLAPRFFPLWDRAIAEAYGLPLGQKGGNAQRYRRFMGIVKGQVQRLDREQAIGRNPLKAIDEYNYCKYTKRWI